MGLLSGVVGILSRPIGGPMSLTPSPAPPPSLEQSARELDVAIAERLFDWSIGRTAPACGEEPGGSITKPAPPSSPAPAAMMEVVEAMLARGLEFTLSSPTPTEARWDATFWDF